MSTILTDILREIDAREISDRSDGRLPFVVLVGYGGRTNFNFIEFINPEHKWVVCIGFLCVTSICQVGDTINQNESFNIEFTLSKVSLVEFKTVISMNPKLVPTCAMLLINWACDTSFSRKILTRKKCLTEDGVHAILTFCKTQKVVLL